MDLFDTESFILEIKSRPALWDTSLDDYSKREVKKRCWEEIVDIFGGRDMKPDKRNQLLFNMQKRWKSVRGSYAREVARQIRIRNGMDARGRKSEYVFFKQLQFLEKAGGPPDGTEECIFPDDGEPELILEEEKFYLESPSSKKRKTGDEPFFNRTFPDMGKQYKSEAEPFHHLGLADMGKRHQQSEAEPFHHLGLADMEKRYQQSDVDPLHSRSLEDMEKRYQQSDADSLHNRNLVDTDNRYQQIEADEDRMFLLSLLSTLKSIRPDKKLSVKIHLMTILKDAQSKY